MRDVAIACTAMLRAKREKLPMEASSGVAAYQPISSCGYEAAGSAGDTELLSPERQRQWLLVFLLLGLAGRVLRYCLRFPLWEDESFLCASYLHRDFWELLQPLEYHQVAPPLFLWIELAIVKLLGFTEMSLRLFPFLCSVASLFLFRHVAGRLLRGLPLVLAFATFAVAYPCLRYAAEAKQYASDQFASLCLLTLFVAWWQNPAGRRYLWALTAVAPVAIWLSYPAIFVAGGIGLAMAVVLCRARSCRGWTGWLIYCVVVGSSFLAVLFTVAAEQNRAELGFLRDCWAENFPPVNDVVKLARWLVVTHTGELMAYPIGGGHGASTLTFLCFATGVILLMRRRMWLMLLLLLSAFALHFAAAALRRYPYGAHFKFAQHVSPMICLLCGLGAAAWVRAVAAWPRLRTFMLTCCLGFPAVVGLGSMFRDALHPYKTLSDLRARAFAQWFWFNAEFEGEAVCLKSDLGLDMGANTYHDLSWSAMYLCNQRIYSPRHAAGLAPRLDRIAAQTPLRCVLYRDPSYPCDESVVEQWLDDFQRRYQLVSRDFYALPRFDKRERQLNKVDHLEIFRFVPRLGRQLAGL
jgi:hypothetical protein